MLSCLSSKTPEELLQNWPDGRIKLFLTQRALQFRNEHFDLFRSGNYLPLRAAGELADCCIAFARQLERQIAVVIVPRLSSRFGFPPISKQWGDTAIELPEGLSFESGHEVFSGRELPIQNRQARLADAMSMLPFAMIGNQ